MPSRHQAPNGYRGNARWWVVLACCLCVSAAGCAQQHVHASAPVTAAPIPAPSEAERPMTIAPDTDATPPVEAPSAPPQVALESAPPPVSIPAASGPAQACRAACHRSFRGAAARPPAPQISPQLSPVDQASYQRKTNDDVSVAKKICKPPRASNSTPLSRTWSARFAASSPSRLTPARAATGPALRTSPKRRACFPPSSSIRFKACPTPR